MGNWGLRGCGQEGEKRGERKRKRETEREGRERSDRIEIIFVGSGDGFVDRRIIEAYRDHFGSTLNITLVDINPKYEVDFRTIDDLIAKRQNVVGNCCLLIIWPDPHKGGYDIDSVRKLQPQAVLTLYETNGISGSSGFQMFLDENKKYYEYWHEESPEASTLLNLYEVEEVVYREIVMKNSGRLWRPYRLRMVKVKRKS